MTNEELREFRKAILKVSQSEFAYLLGVSVDTVRHWEQGLSKPSHLAMEKVAAVVKKYKRDHNVRQKGV